MAWHYLGLSMWKSFIGECQQLRLFSTYSNYSKTCVKKTCLATDACLTAIPGVASSIPARSHTFVEIDHEIISTVILLPSADSFKKGCCQLQAKVCARITGYPLVQVCPGKSVVRWTDRPAMTIAVDLGRKATKQTNKTCVKGPLKNKQNIDLSDKW